MALTDFDDALRAVLVHEGGKVDDPRDPGGRTNKGVIQRVYDGYRRRKGMPKRDVWEMDYVECREIYKLQYWDKIHGADLPLGVAYVVFDGAVNSGPVQSVKWLQRALRMNNVDGLIGQATLAAVESCPDYDRLIADICAQRLAFLKALKTFKTYGRGWTSRVNQVLAHGQDLATGGRGIQLAFCGGNCKADIRDARDAPSPVYAAVGGASGGGGLALLSQTKDYLGDIQYQLQDYVSVPLVNQILTYLTIASAVVGIAGLLYGLYAKFAAAKRADALGVPA